MKFFLFLFLFTSTAIAQQTISDLTAKKFKVVSTTEGSKPCPLMTETQRNAIGSPLNGQCIYNTTTSKLNVYNGTIWKAAGGGVDSWLTGTVYASGDLVIESAKIYQCLIAHTSGTFATDLAALKWEEISSTVPVNLTGPITSVGNATSVASQTGTGSKFVMDNTPTLITPNIGAATGTSLSLAGNITAYNYDKDNLLVNGNIENPLSSEWTCTVGTCTRTITAGEFSKDSAALKVALSSQAMNVSQSVNTPSGIQKQGYARVIYRAPSTMADFQICSLVDGSEQTCVPSANLVLDDTFRSIEIPLIFGSTSAGIKFKTTSTYTANAYFDGAIVAQGLGTQNLMLDNVYSAFITSPTTISLTNKPGWISSVVNNSAGDYTVNFPTGQFSVTPSCVCTVQGGSSRTCSTYSASTGSINVQTLNVSLQNNNFNLICQKSGNDYLAASANVYSQASANYDWTSYTSSLTGFTGTTTATCKHRRVGGDLEGQCYWTTGTTGASLFSMSLPLGLTIDSARILAANTTASAGQVVGEMRAQSAGTLAASILTATGTSTSLLYIGAAYANPNILIPANSNAVFASSLPASIYFKVPIAGWSNSNSITGSFAGYNSTPGSVNPKLRSSILTCTASSAIVSQGIGTSWVTSVGNISSGSCAITLPSGVFNLTPICMVSRSGAGVSTTSWAASASSATSVSVHCNSGGANCAGGENINFYCHGE